MFSNCIDYLDKQKDHGFISTTIIKTRLMFNRHSASHDGMLSYIAQLVQNLQAQSTNGPGPLNIAFRSDMPITFFISDFTT